MKRFTLALLFFAATTANAQTKQTAVYAIECQSGARTTVQAYSLWEANQASSLRFDLDARTPYIQQLSQKAGEIAKYDPVIADHINDRIKFITTTAQEVAMVDSVDGQIDYPTGVFPDNRSGCQQPVAVIATAQFPDLGANYMVAQPLWNKMTEAQKTASFINLFLAELANSKEGRSTKLTKQYVANLFSTSWSSMKPFDYINLLKSMEFVDTNGNPERLSGFNFLGLGLRTTKVILDDSKSIVKRLDGYIQNQPVDIKVPGIGVEVTVGNGGDNWRADAIVGEDGLFSAPIQKSVRVALQDGSQVEFVGKNEMKPDQWGKKDYAPRFIYDPGKKYVCGSPSEQRVSNLSNSYSIGQKVNETYCSFTNGEIAFVQIKEWAVVLAKLGRTQVPLVGKAISPVQSGNRIERITLSFCGPFKGMKLAGDTKERTGIFQAEWFQDGSIRVWDHGGQSCPRRDKDRYQYFN